MTIDEQHQLAVLLRRLAAAGGGVPNMPRPVWDALAGLVPLVAVELLVSQDGHDVLLTHRDDPPWHGWHIPGGFLGRNEGLADACRRIAARELATELTLERIVGDYAWPDHPQGSVLSILCACRVHAPPQTGRFFTALPGMMVAHHAAFVARYRETMR